MMTLINVWRAKANSIRGAVNMLRELDESLDDEEESEPDSILLKREDLEIKEKTLLKTAAVYDECADELQSKLWEV